MQPRITLRSFAFSRSCAADVIVSTRIPSSFVLYRTCQAAIIPASMGWCLLVQLGGNSRIFTCSLGSMRSAWLLWLFMMMRRTFSLVTSARVAGNHHSLNTRAPDHAFFWLKYLMGEPWILKHRGSLAVPIKDSGTYARWRS
ncbi:unnamed protein product [Ectocarpus sp. CCAP 1310/34]|nr:unnamed protein product [Ectocarpus sp. CCAP 1310/34]